MRPTSFAFSDSQTSSACRSLRSRSAKSLLVGDPEGDVEHALLHVAELHHPCKQERPHLGDGRAHRVAGLAEQVPEDDRRGAIGIVGHPDLHGARLQCVTGLRGRVSGAGEARDIALGVLHKNRDAGRGKCLRKALKRHGLAGSGGTRDQPVPVGIAEQELLGVGIGRPAAAYEDRIVRHAFHSKVVEIEPDLNGWVLECNASLICQVQGYATSSLLDWAAEHPSAAFFCSAITLGS